MVFIDNFRGQLELARSLGILPGNGLTRQASCQRLHMLCELNRTGYDGLEAYPTLLAEQID